MALGATGRGAGYLKPVPKFLRCLLVRHGPVLRIPKRHGCFCHRSSVFRDHLLCRLGEPCRRNSHTGGSVCLEKCRTLHFLKTLPHLQSQSTQVKMSPRKRRRSVAGGLSGSYTAPKVGGCMETWVEDSQI